MAPDPNGLPFCVAERIDPLQPSDDLVPSAEVQSRLNALNCYWGCDMDDYHQVWITAWGFSFIVPMIGRDRACPIDILMEIEAEIRRIKP